MSAGSSSAGGKVKPRVFVLLKKSEIGERFAVDLTALGYDAVAFEDKAPLLGAARRQQPMVCIVEDSSVGMNLSRFADHLRGRVEKPIPVVVISNLRYKRSTLEILRLELGMGDILQKPVSLSDLDRSLRRYCNPDSENIIEYLSPCEVFYSHLGLAVRSSRHVALVRESGDEAIHLFIRGYRLLGVTSNQPHKQDLGEILVEAGHARGVDVKRARSKLAKAEGEKKLGQILLSRNQVEEEDLMEAIQTQARRRVMDVFSWREGRTQLLSGERPPPWAANLRVSLLPVVLKALKKHGNPELFSLLSERFKEARLNVPQAARRRLTTLSDDQKEKALVRSLVKGKSYSQVAQDSGLDANTTGAWLTLLTQVLGVEVSLQSRATTLSAYAKLRDFKKSFKRQGPTPSRSQSVGASMKRGMDFIQKGLHDKAIKHFEAILKTNPEHPTASAYLGWCVYMKAAASGAVAVEEDDPAQTIVAMNETHRATDLIERSIQMRPDEAMSHIFLGRIYRDQGDARKASHAFLNALEADPRSTEALEALKETHHESVVTRASQSGAEGRASGGTSDGQWPEERTEERTTVDASPPEMTKAPPPKTGEEPAVLEPPVASESALNEFGAGQQDRESFSLMVLSWSPVGASAQTAQSGGELIPAQTKGHLLRKISGLNAKLEEFSTSQLSAVVLKEDPFDNHRLRAVGLSIKLLAILRTAASGGSELLFNARASLVNGLLPLENPEAEFKRTARIAARLIKTGDDWRLTCRSGFIEGIESLVESRPKEGQPGVVQVLQCMAPAQDGLDSTMKVAPPDLEGGSSQAEGMGDDETIVVRKEAVLGDTGAPLPGSQLGVYKVVRLIGTGGMGNVYLAVDVNLGREVAIKQMKPEVLTLPKALNRFRIEAKSLAMINSPFVTQIYALSLDSKSPYLVMEYVDGPSVFQLINERGAFPLDESVGLVHQAVRGLQVVLSKGLIHRDITPKNLLIDQEGILKITDFGLVKGEFLSHSRSMTGAVVGTPMYMSPEQAKGNSLDFRTDLYSLGMTFFHMVVGKPLFSGKTVAEVLIKHISQPPLPISQFVSGVPKELDDLFLEIVAKDPEKRPSSYAEVLGRLRQVRVAYEFQSQASFTSGRLEGDKRDGDGRDGRKRDGDGRDGGKRDGRDGGKRDGGKRGGGGRRGAP